MIKAVIYDMDGLIIDSEPLWREAEIAIFQSIGVPMTEVMCLEVKGTRLDEVVHYWHLRYPWEGPSKKEIENKIIDEMIRLIMEKGQPLPGVHESLSLFKALGLKIALASSSSSRIIEAVLKTMQIKEAFEIIQSAETEPFGKPHPGVFITTANKLSIEVSDCLVLEDSLNGVIAGLAAKMKVIAIPESVEQHDVRFNVAHKQLNSLIELNSGIINAL